MYTDKYLPFLKKSPLLGREVTTINVEDLFFPVEVKNLDKESYDEIEEYLDAERPRVLHIKPLNIYVMEAPVDKVAWYIQRGGEIEVEDVDVDYQKIARFIEVDEIDGRYMAFYPTGSSFEGIEINDGKLINYARNRIDVSEMDGQREVSESRNPVVDEVRKEIIEMGKSVFDDDITEALLDNPDEFFSDEVDRIEQEGDSDLRGESPSVEGGLNVVESVLDSYLSGGFVTERVPLLAGPTAVMKSVTVKEMAKKHGYRMVDFRAAFMSRLDLEGLMERVEVEGKVEAFNAGMFNIIECTDEFLDFCEEAIEKIENKIDELRDREDEENQQEIAELEKMLSYYEEKSQPAVLFFDEVTRAGAPILNALTTILNQKEFLGYPMSRSKILAATNLPTNLSEEYRQLYTQKEIKDAATADRFQTIKVNPEDVEEKWTNWAENVDSEGKQNIHPVIAEYLNENPHQKYNFDDVIDEFENNGRDKSRLYTTAFPNYRTWDLLTNYINKKEATETPLSVNAIKGLVGKEVTEPLVEKLEEAGFEVERGSAQGEMDDVVEQGMATGTPTMLLGPSSIGKTTRVKNIAEKYGVKKENFIKINLAQQDAIDIMGPPTKVDLAAYVGGHGQGDSGDIFGDESEIGRELRDMVKGSFLPEKVTIKAPKTDLASIIRNAMENRERVVIFFDEFNRVEDDSVMSAVFEAVSDNRIFGVDFDPELVQIFTAANIGKEYGGAEDFDPAFAARFNIYRKDGYDVHDVRNFKEWMENSGYNKHIQEYVDSKPEEEVLEMISEIDLRALKDSVPSLRAFTDLDKYLSDTSEASKKYKGTILFSDDQSDLLYTNIVTSDEVTSKDTVKDMKQTCEKIFEKIDNWAALDTEFTVEFRGKEIDAEDVNILLRNAYNKIYVENPNTNLDGKESTIRMLHALITRAYAVDTSVQNQREGVIETTLGSHAAKDFLNYYNMVSGTDEVEVEISDLKDKSLIPSFFNQRVTVMDNIDDKINSTVGYYSDFLDEFGDSLSVEHYREFVRESLSIMPSVDAGNNLLSKVALSDETDKVLSIAENNDDDFIRDLLNKAGVPVSDEELEKAKSSSGEEGPKPKMLGSE